MDPIRLAASVIGMISQVKAITSILSGAAKYMNTELVTAGVELEIFTTILREVTQTALSTTSTLPESATLSLKLCETYLQRVESRLSYLTLSDESLSRRFKREKSLDSLAKDLKDYRRSVKILRDIVMDATTQDLLVKNATNRAAAVYEQILHDHINQAAEGTGMTEQQIETLIQRLATMLRSSTAGTDDSDVDKRSTAKAGFQGGLSEETLASLRRAAQAVHTTSRPAQTASNPFEFYAKIIHTGDLSEEAARFCALFDTGSEDNWISATVVARAGLQDLVESTIQEKLYTGADGSTFCPAGVISMSWTRDGTKSWQTSFLVLENVPFDILLGRRFIVDEGLFVFADSVLVSDLTRLAPLSEDDFHQMEQNLRDRGVENEELSNTREAKDAAARERRRAKKAASRAGVATSRLSLATTPGSATPSSHDPVTTLSQATSTTNENVISESV